MPAKEIKELRQSGKLKEALHLAQNELELDPNNIWSKRNISWVYMDIIKKPETAFNVIVDSINELKSLSLPINEEFFYDNFCWVIGKIVFDITRFHNSNSRSEMNTAFLKVSKLLESIKSFPLQRKSQGYIFLFKAFHKALKEYHVYLDFVDWWGLDNFLPECYETEMLPNGKPIISLVEQTYIAYAKRLLPYYNANGEKVFDRARVETFLSRLTSIIFARPDYVYPVYYKGKLLLELGEKSSILQLIVPFAKRKSGEFWVWELLGDTYPEKSDDAIACYCKGLLCKSPDKMMVSLKQKIARTLVDMGLFVEAKTEVEGIIKSRTDNGYKIPDEIVKWQSMPWYVSTTSRESNEQFYKKYASRANDILFQDSPEDLVIVEFVNRDKKVAHFIKTNGLQGFCKYDRFVTSLQIGDTLSIRVKEVNSDGLHKLYNATVVDNQELKAEFLKIVSGTLRIPDGKSFGFVEDVYIHPSILKSKQLKNGVSFECRAIKRFDKEKQEWVWKGFL